MRRAHAPSMTEEIRNLGTGLYRFHDKLDGEALTALCTTTGQYGATAFSGHTSTEAMSLSALALIRLIRALHNITLSSCKNRASVRIYYAFDQSQQVLFPSKTSIQKSISTRRGKPVVTCLG